MSDNLPFDPKARIDPQTGMYTMPDDNFKLQSEFVEVDGILIPTPTGKLVTQVRYLSGLAFECSESVTEVEDAFNSVEDWITFHEPVYNSEFRVRNDATVDAPIIINEAWKDMNLFKLEMEQRKLQVKVGERQLNEAKLANLPNRAGRRGN